MNWRYISLSFLGTLSGCMTFDLYSEEGKRRLEHVSLRIDAFDVEIASRGEPIWHGIAKVNRMQPAVYSVDALEASGPQCRPIRTGLSDSYKLVFQINKYGGNAKDPDTYRFSANIRRSDLAPDCKEMIVTNANVEKDLVKTRRGQRLEFMGEDGFSVGITRR